MKLREFFRIITVYGRIFLFINTRENQCGKRIRNLFLKAGKIRMLTVYEFFFDEPGKTGGQPYTNFSLPLHVPPDPFAGKS